MPIKMLTLDSGINLITVGILLYVIIALGLSSGSKVKTLRDYVLGNQLSLSFLVMSLFATFIDGIDLLILPSLFAQKGIVQLLPSIGILIAFILGAKLLVPSLYPAGKKLTLGEIVQEFYGSKIRYTLAVLWTLSSLGIAIVQIIIFGKILNILAGVPPTIGSIIGGMIIIAYANAGGIQSVVVTDVFQFIMLAMFIGEIMNLLAMESGPIQIIYSKFKSLYPDRLTLFSNANFSKYFFLAIFNALSGFLLAPQYIQRILMVGNPIKSRKLLYNTAGLYIIFLTTMLIIGFGLQLHYPALLADNPIPNLIMQKFPTVLQGALMYGMFCIILSTADSCLHASSLILSIDLIFPALNIKTEASNVVSYVRKITFGLGVCAIICAILCEAFSLNMFALISYMNTCYASVFIPLLMGLKGFQVDKRSFWLSFGSTLPIFFIGLIFFKEKVELFLFLGAIINIIVFFTSLYWFKGGIKKRVIPKTPEKPLSPHFRSVSDLVAELGWDGDKWDEYWKNTEKKDQEKKENE